MASVQNRANPLGEYGEIRTNVIRSNTTLYGVTGSFTSVVGAPALRLNTTNSAIISSSMGAGDMIIVTGAGGGTATPYFKLASGSTSAIWAGANLTWTSPGQA